MADGWIDETPAGQWAWETAVPGPELAQAVAAADLASLPGEARVSLLKAVSRLSGWVSVAMARATAGVADAVEEAVIDLPGGRGTRAEGWAAEEVAAALRLAPRTAASRIAASRALVQRWPALGNAVTSGQLTWAQALVVAEGVAVLDGCVGGDGQDLSDVAVERILLTADRYPPARLRARVTSLALSLDPGAADRRRRRETRDRTDVGLWDDPDGVATVFVRGSAPDAVVLRDAIHARAREMAATADVAAEAGEGGRTIGQWRVAAVMTAFGLVPRGMPAAAAPVPADSGASERATRTGLGTTPCAPATVGASPASIEVRVTVDLATLLGLADDPGWLEGYGPIDPGLARQLAADGEWVRWVTDPVTGHLLDSGDRRLPGARLARFVRARDNRCAHPTCGVRAARCDIDHVPEYRLTGRSRAAELTMTCPRHNRGRDPSGWRAEAAEFHDPFAGPEPTWTSALGQRYRSVSDAKLPFTCVAPGLAPPERPHV